ncbi:MAG: hypothetical protein ACOYKA_04580 [Legionellaceae bacterium]
MTKNSKNENAKEKLKALGTLLPKLSSLYDLTLQEGRAIFFDIKEISDSYLAYEFYITPDELHRLLMETSHSYCGYRGGESIETLAHPESSAIKHLQEIPCIYFLS